MVGGQEQRGQGSEEKKGAGRGFLSPKSWKQRVLADKGWKCVHFLRVFACLHEKQPPPHFRHLAQAAKYKLLTCQTLS